MKMYLLRLLALAVVFSTLQFTSYAQVMNPADPVVEYSGGTVQQPVSGQVGDWVKTTRLNWNTSEFKAYIYKGNIFRLKFPKTYQHNVNDGKTYPVFIFFHGLGEAADENLYDNEYQLYHGGQRHMNAVNDGRFDGFLLYMQNQYGFFGTAHYDAIAEILNNFLGPQNKADLNRVYVDGLSAGGNATWEFTLRHPNLVAAALPISAALNTYNTPANMNILKYIPIWHFQGGLDKNPNPGVSEGLGQAILNAGGSYRYTKYPNLGHGCWNDAWSEPDFYSFMLRAHKANPIPLFGKFEFCAGENVNVTLGVSAGFNGYQWRKNGNLIPGATSNTLTIQGTQAATFGTYECRILRGSTWSPWSPTPIVIKLKSPTVPPPIQTEGLMSRVIPAPDGNTSVTLFQPTNYQTYSWTRQGNATVLSTTNTFTTSTPGNYLVKVTEQFGCVSEFSQPFTVVNANGPNKPDAPTGVIATPLSLSQIKIDWSQNPYPTNNETNFEIYQATEAGGPYTLVGITGQDVTSHTITNLKQGTKYYYILRAVNNTGASGTTSVVSASTIPDDLPPSIPSNFRISSSSSTSVTLAWNAASDNIGIQGYDIFINDVKSYVTTGTSFVCYNLSSSAGGYNFYVKARDVSGNSSGATNIVYAMMPSTIPSRPEAPSNVVATALSYSKIKLTWVDNSNAETGYQIFRSTNPNTGFAPVNILPSNATTYTDSVSVNPGTTYYYRVHTLYQFGSNPHTGAIDANWRFDNNYSDASGNNKTITASGTSFNSNDKKQGSHAVNFNGSNQHIDMSSSSNDYLRGAYTDKTVAFWMKSTNNTGNRIIIDIGGSDNGLSLRLDANRLYAGVASNSVRRNFFVNYTSTAWNHVALVYSGNTLRLYLNGVLAGSNTDLGFTSVRATSNASRIGYVNGSNAFNTGTGRYAGLLDDLNIFSSALTEEQISNLINGTVTSATTPILPGLPATPSNLLASPISSNANRITWNDNSNNETGFNLYKSDIDNQNYILLGTLPANTTSYTDGNLYANTIRYYRIQALNDGGNSGFSNADSAKTWAYMPVVNTVSDRYMRVGTSLQVSVQATSPLNGPLTLNASNLPPFASFSSVGGNGTITFSNPQSLATYPNITITATDPYGQGSASFTLVVNNNYEPVLPAISNINLNEGQSNILNLTATDQNPGDVLTWNFTGLPGFVTVTSNGGSAQLSIAPGYADHGSYNVTAQVNDNNNGSVTRSFTINVTDVNPSQRIYVNFSGPGSPPAPSIWNSLNDMPGLNDVYNNLKDQSGNTTPVAMKVTSAWGSIGNGSNLLGSNTGNNSGVYPDAVMQSAWWTDNNPQVIKIYGLDPTKKYNFTLFGSRANVSDSRVSQYTVTGISASNATLEAVNNSQNVAVLQNVSPNADTIELRLSAAPGSQFAYLNAMIIETTFDDATPPAKPKNLNVQLTNSAVLTWVDAAYNETNYEIYRSTQLGSGYELLNSINPNLQTYSDATISGNRTYYYFVKAVNAYGFANSDTASVTTGNGTPVMAVIPNVVMKIDESQDVNITVTDDLGDVITLSATNLPSFATLIDNGNGTGIIRLEPGNAVGIFNNVTVKATDASGATTTRTFRIVVKDIFTSVYVNFSHNASFPVPSPWNSFTSVPFMNKSLTNMMDDSETPTTISITQLDSWEGGNDQGATTGDNTGIFPDNVMKTVYYQSSSTPMRLRISGLTAPNTKYNLVFFASRLAGDNRSTVYTANGQSVTLNAANNTTNTVQINGLVPDANGVIEFSCSKGGTSPYAYLGALVIQSYVDDGIPAAPSNLKVLATSKTAVRLTWADKSSNETGFDIERSESFVGPYTVIATTAANANSYINNSGLTANKVYYYRVRARKGTNVFSSYTSIESTTTIQYSIQINFNRQNNASSPWNNTARAPEEGRSFNNLRNDLNNTSGVNMTIIDNFNGDNPEGMNTGNNSGVFPDNVLRSSWWVDAGFVAKLRFANLNQNMSYSFVFLGSRNGGGDRTSVYTINGKSVSLNAAYNTTQTVQLDNVKADENGEVYLTVSLAQYAMFAYLNGLVIHGYTEGESGNPNEVINQPLKAYAGLDKQITLPTNSVQLAGTSIDGNGSSVTYNWTKTQGPAQFSIDDNTSSNPVISNLVVGTYTFRLTVTDNLGATSFDDVNVVVDPAPAITPPTANAGEDINITLPVNTTQLAGSGTDDGTIVSYSWTKISGPAVFSISNNTIANPIVSNLLEGTYTFQLTVTDNQGATGTDEINVIVAPSTGPKIIKVNVTGTLNPYNNAEWNNWNSLSSWNSSAFNYSDGSPSGVTASLSNQQGISDNSATYTTTAMPSQVGRYASYSTLNRTLTISNLDPNKTYTLEVLGSRSGAGPNSTRYIIGATSIDIDAANNSADLAVFAAISPTASGQIVLNLQKLNTYNYINGFILSEDGSGEQNARITSRAQMEETQAVSTKFAANPNPFRDHVTVSAHFETVQERVTVRMIDATGKVVVTKYIGQVQKGQWNYRLDVSDKNLKSGVYFLQVLSPASDQPPASLKLIKTE